MRSIAVCLLVSSCVSSCLPKGDGETWATTPRPAEEQRSEDKLVSAPATAGEPSSTEPDFAAEELNLHPGVGIGEIKLGMTRTQTRELLGPPAPAGASPGFDQYYDKGLSIYFEKDVVAAVHAYSGRLGGYERDTWTPFDIRGKHRLTFASTKAQIVARWGTPLRGDDSAHAPIPYGWIVYPGVLFNYTLSNGQLFHCVVTGKMN